MKFLSRFSDDAYALLRIASGFMISFHGMQKLFGILTEHQPPVGSQLWIGGIFELACGVLIFLGLRTRLAAFLISGTMAVAYLQFHWQLRLNVNMLPIVNKGELAVLYCLVFFFIATRGTVKWGLDKK